jgi:Flp pilus assembly protein TadD
MSVINKMLRDLDKRQTTDAAQARSQAARTGLARGTLIVDDADAGRPRRPARTGVLAAVLLLSLGAAGAAWWWRQPDKSAAPEMALATATPSPITEPVPPPPPAVQTTTATLPASPAAPAAVAANASLDGARAPLKAQPTAPAPALIIRAPEPATVAPTAAAAAAPILPKAPPPAASPATPAPVPASSPAPAMQALAQAQSLWNSGAHEAALELLREALAVVERAAAGNPTLLATLARELARMEMAQGRVAPALSLLTRLEPALSGVAEVWALRGNAAQRLGRHEESAAAYLMALKLRPNEARWMLGAAVSLAAQGQTASAAELAEKARAGGALSPDVAGYLRQLGVPLQER